MKLKIRLGVAVCTIMLLLSGVGPAFAEFPSPGSLAQSMIIARMQARLAAENAQKLSAQQAQAGDAALQTRYDKLHTAYDKLQTAYDKLAKLDDSIAAENEHNNDLILVGQAKEASLTAQVATLTAQVTALATRPERGPFDFSDPGHLALGTIALAVGLIAGLALMAVFARLVGRRTAVSDGAQSYLAGERPEIGRMHRESEQESDARTDA